MAGGVNNITLTQWGKYYKVDVPVTTPQHDVTSLIDGLLAMDIITVS